MAMVDRSKLVSSLRALWLSLPVFASLNVAGPAEAQTRSLSRASVSSSGVEGNGASTASSLASSGSLISFSSSADNLIGGDPNSAFDVFLRDLTQGTTVLVSQEMAIGSGASGAILPSEQGREHDSNGDGSSIAFASDAFDLAPSDSNGARDVFVRDVLQSTTAIMSVNQAGFAGNGASLHPSISSNGRIVAFASSASDLVAGDTNGVRDVFVRDRDLGVTERISISSSSEEAGAASDYPSISDDGTRVAFSSAAANLLLEDFNGAEDVFLRNRTAGTTTLVSRSRGGSETDGASAEPALSGDGLFVAYSSVARNIVADDTNAKRDIFVYNVTTGRSERVSVSSTGRQANGDSSAPALSSDGRYVVFVSSATNLVSGDKNGVDDIFLRDRLTGITSLVSVAPDGTASNGASYKPDVNADATLISFSSAATTLAAADLNGADDVFAGEPAPVFTRDLVLSDPPQATVAGNSVSITLPLFAGISTKRSPAGNPPPSARASFGSVPEISAATARRPTRRAQPLNLKYQVSLTRPTGTTRERVSKRNTFAFSNLPSGQYSARYRLIGQRDRRTTFRTKFSPSQGFTIQ